MARVTAVPEWHPEHDGFEPFPVHCWVVHHPGGPVVVDTGIGTGHDLIDELYRPEVVDLGEALGSIDLGIDDVVACVLTHLHFDHCGQLGALRCPVHVQAVEHEAAGAPRYTVPEWASVPAERLRLSHGDDGICDGVSVLATPGHTPGHQSVVVEGGGRRVVLGGPCAFRSEEVVSGQPGATNLHDPSWFGAAASSLQRIRALGPATVELSHDARVVDVG